MRERLQRALIFRCRMHGSMKIPFDNTYARLPERFFARQSPAAVPGASLIRLNDGLAAQLGLQLVPIEPENMKPTTKTAKTRRKE